jgi:hypothetical protein
VQTPIKCASSRLTIQNNRQKKREAEASLFYDSNNSWFKPALN